MTPGVGDMHEWQTDTLVTSGVCYTTLHQNQVGYGFSTQDYKWCTLWHRVQTVQRHSWLPKCHTVSWCTLKCNFAYTHNRRKLGLPWTISPETHIVMSDPLYQTSPAPDNRCMKLRPSVQEGFTLHRFPQNSHYPNFVEFSRTKFYPNCLKSVENADQVLLTP